MKKLMVFSMIILIFLSWACERKPLGYWREPGIAVIADSLEWQIFETPLSSIFEEELKTPQLELKYSVFRIQENQFKQYDAFRYLIVAGSIDAKGTAGSLIRQVMADSVMKDGIMNNRYFVFSQRDQWAQEQLVVFMIAQNVDELREKIENNRHFIYNLINTDLESYLTKDMFRKGEQIEIEEKLLTTYGWKIRVQHDYFIAQEDPDNNMVWFRRMYPERWIFVRWIDNADPALLNPEWVIDERNRLGFDYYGGDKVAQEYLKVVTDTTFLTRPAVITTGLWENDEKVAGGPFKNYTFYDAFSERLYMIDVAVYAPAEEKMPYLRRAEIIANSFKTIVD